MGGFAGGGRLCYRPGLAAGGGQFRGAHQPPALEHSSAGERLHSAATAASCLVLACSSARLLVAEGTVPMYYQGVKYNIPVALWLPERYPLQPPMMCVLLPRWGGG